MTAVTVASLDDLRQVVSELVDIDAPLVVDRRRARRMLDLSDTTFGRLLNEGVIRPVPHLRPAKYSVERLRRFADGDETAFQFSAAADLSVPAIDGPSGSSTDAPCGGSVSPLRPPGPGGPSSTADGGSHPPPAA